MNNINQKKKGIHISKSGNNCILQLLNTQDSSNVNVLLSTKQPNGEPQNRLIDDGSSGFTQPFKGSWISIVLPKHKAKLSCYLLRCDPYW
jgi:hypothetical protein